MRINSKILPCILKWFWPAAALVTPWAVWPFGPHSLAQSHIAHYAFAYVTVLLWLLLNFRNLRLPNVRSALWFLGRRRHLAALAAFSVWTLLASALAPQPILSLTGNLNTYRDAALHFPALMAIALLVAAQAGRDPGLAERTARAVVLTGVLLAAAAAVEIIIGRGLFYKTHGIAQVVFPGQGHLAGFLAMSAGVAGGLSGVWGWASLALLGLGIGVTMNRTSIGAGVAVLLSNLARPWSQRIKIATLFLSFVALGWGVYNASTDRFRKLTSPHTLQTRLVYWRIALDGIMARPLVGWGGGQYPLHISSTANENDIKLLLGEKEPIKSIVFKEGDFYLFRDRNGALGTRRILDWSPHNFVLETTLSWGLIGLAFYLYALFYAVRPAFSGNPASLGILAYHLFLLLWPSSVESAGVLWILFGLAGSDRPPMTRTRG